MPFGLVDDLRASTSSLNSTIILANGVPFLSTRPVTAISPGERVWVTVGEGVTEAVPGICVEEGMLVNIGVDDLVGDNEEVAPGLMVCDGVRDCVPGARVAADGAGVPGGVSRVANGV